MHLQNLLKTFDYTDLIDISHNNFKLSRLNAGKVHRRITRDDNIQEMSTINLLELIKEKNFIAYQSAYIHTNLLSFDLDVLELLPKDKHNETILNIMRVGKETGFNFAGCYVTSSYLQKVVTKVTPSKEGVIKIPKIYKDYFGIRLLLELETPILKDRFKSSYIRLCNEIDKKVLLPVFNDKSIVLDKNLQPYGTAIFGMSHSKFCKENNVVEDGCVINYDYGLCDFK